MMTPVSLVAAGCIALCFLLLVASSWRRARYLPGDRGSTFLSTPNALKAEDASIGQGPDHLRCGALDDAGALGIKALDELRQGRLARSAHCFQVW